MVKAPLIKIISWVYVPPVGIMFSGAVRSFFWAEMGFTEDQLSNQGDTESYQIWSKLIGILFAKITIFKSILMIKIKSQILKLIMGSIKSIEDSLNDRDIKKKFYINIFKKFIISTKLFQDVSRFYKDPEYINMLILKNKIKDLELIENEILSSWELQTAVVAKSASGAAAASKAGAWVAGAGAVGAGGVATEAYLAKNSYFGSIKENYLESLRNETSNILNNNNNSGMGEELDNFLKISYSDLFNKNGIINDDINIKNFVNNESYIHEKINFSFSFNTGIDMGVGVKEKKKYLIGCSALSGLTDLPSIGGGGDLQNIANNLDIEPFKNKIIEASQKVVDCIEDFDDSALLGGGTDEIKPSSTPQPINGMKYVIKNFKSKNKDNKEILKDNKFLNNFLLISITGIFQIIKIYF